MKSWFTSLHQTKEKLGEGRVSPILTLQKTLPCIFVALFNFKWKQSPFSSPWKWWKIHDQPPSTPGILSDRNQESQWLDCSTLPNGTWWPSKWQFWNNYSVTKHRNTTGFWTYKIHPYQKEIHLLKASALCICFCHESFGGMYIVCFKSPNDELSGRFAAVSSNEKWHKSCTLHDKDTDFGGWHLTHLFIYIYVHVTDSDIYYHVSSVRNPYGIPYNPYITG